MLVVGIKLSIFCLNADLDNDVNQHRDARCEAPAVIVRHMLFESAFRQAHPVLSSDLYGFTSERDT